MKKVIKRYFLLFSGNIDYMGIYHYPDETVTTGGVFVGIILFPFAILGLILYYYLVTIP